MRINLTVKAGPHEGQVFEFTERANFIVGRSECAHFRLPIKDKRISRIHFMIEMNPPQCRLTDMESTNGTKVNGQKVARAELKDGDLITAGQSVLLVSVLGSDEPPGSPAETPLTPRAAAVAASSIQPLSTVDYPQPVPGYRVVRELGRGGMGVVYEARRAVDGRLVALKTIKPAVEPSPADIERFLREAQILSELDHPNIVSFHEMGESQGLLYFAMDHVAGTDAAQLLRQHGGPLPVALAVDLVCQLLRALDYAHAKGFVHRDVKPANMLVSQEGGLNVVKLSDFGLSRIYQTSKMSGLTTDNEWGGTAPFMAPEQINDLRATKPPADQYSAGATLYNLLTDDFVYDFPARLHAKIMKILLEDPVPIRDRRPDLPEALAAIIHRALARDPQARYASVREMRRALVPFAT